MTTPLILASGSQVRAQLLQASNIAHEVDPANIDEDSLKADMVDAAPVEIAQALASAKAVEVSTRRPGQLVLGADQVLSYRKRLLSKPRDREGAARQIAQLANGTHHLISSVSLAKDGVVVWATSDEAKMTMRPLSDAYIEAYLNRNWPAVGSSVGSYHIEGEGPRLFSAMDGDYFTVLGLPLLPLVAWLADEGVIET